jgi:hypothetical protein
MTGTINQGVQRSNQVPQRVYSGQPRPQEPGVLAGAVNSVTDAARGVASVAERAWESTSEEAQQVASTVAHAAEDGWDAVHNCMRRNPVAVFFTGITLGALVTMALNRR